MYIPESIIGFILGAVLTFAMLAWLAAKSNHNDDNNSNSNL